METIKLAIPVHGGRVSAHFGHPDFFSLVTVDRTSQEVIEREDLVPPAHAPGVLPEWLAKQGAQVVLAGGIGPRAVRLLETAGMNVITGIPTVPVEQVITFWLGDRLQAGGNACTHGADHTCGGH